MDPLLAALGSVFVLFGVFGLFAGASPLLTYTHVVGGGALLIAAGLLLVHPKPMFDVLGIGLVIVVAAMQRGFRPRLRFPPSGG